MASSKVMASRSPPNQDLTRQQSPSQLRLRSDQSRGFDSMNMEEILKSFCSDSDSFALDNTAVDDGAGGGGGRMTLEDFLAKARAENEKDGGAPDPATGAIGMDQTMMNPAIGVPAVQFAPAVGFGVEIGGEIVSTSVGRGKRKAAVDAAPLDKATQQKERRMIKNRESAARSRERKQAYTVELESLVTHLEEENARLLKEEAELTKERYKQLMETLIPVAEKPRAPRILRRTNSINW